MASSVARFFVEIGADVSNYEKSMSTAASVNNEMVKSFDTLSKAITNDYKILAQNAVDLGISQKELEANLLTLGLQHKAMTASMVNDSDAIHASFLKSVGTFMAASTASEKALSSFKQYAPVLGAVNTGFLKVTNSLDKFAKANTIALTALRELGPTAKMSELNKRMGELRAGMARFRTAATLAAIATGLLVIGLHNLAINSDKALKGDLAAAGDKWLKALKPLGEVIADIERALLNIVDPIADFFIWLNKVDPVLSKVVLGFFAMIIPITLLAAPLAIGTTLAGSFALAMSALWTAIAPVIIAFATIVGWAILIAAAIAALIYIIVKLVQNWDVIKKKTIEVWEAIKKAFSDAWEKIKTTMENLWNSIKDTWDKIVTAIKNAWTKIKSISAADVGEFIGTIIRKIIELPPKIWKWLTDIGNKIATKFTEFVAKAKKMGADFVNGVINFVKTLPSKIVTWFNTVKAKIEFYRNKFLYESKKMGTNIVNGIINFVKTLPKKVGGLFQDIIDKITGFSSKMYQKAKSMAKNFWSGFKKGLGISSPSLVERAFMAMNEQAQTTVRGIMSKVPKLTNALGRAMSPLMPTVETGAQPVDRGIPSPGGQAINFFGPVNVRSEQDIIEISNRLYRLQQNQLRGRGKGGTV